VKRTRPVALVLAALLVGGYGYRAFVGIRAGWAFEKGRDAYGHRIYEEATPLLESSAVGFLGLRATRLAAEAQKELWERQEDLKGAVTADPAPLVAAADGFLRCRCLSPASRRSWEGLGEVYNQLEWIERERRALTSFQPGVPPWSRVGRQGRIAIGMIRAALELAPNWYSLLDELALTFWAYGLEEESREAIRASALSLPLFYRHRYWRVPDTPQWMLDTFAEASREALGQVPLLAPVSHLNDLGKLDLLRGEYELAAATLEEALGKRGDATNRAETEFNLALALLALGDEARGREHLELAAENPVFRAASLRELARVDRLSGDLASAVERLRQLRYEDPSNLDYCLEFAEMAKQIPNWPAVIEALRWARLIHPEDPRPHVALVDAYLDMDDTTAASVVFREIEDLKDLAVDPDELQRLEWRIEVEAGG
jgi:tetratricopeptide (TPR) repeat protein